RAGRAARTPGARSSRFLPAQLPQPALERVDTAANGAIRQVEDLADLGLSQAIEPAEDRDFELLSGDCKRQRRKLAAGRKDVVRGRRGHVLESLACGSLAGTFAHAIDRETRGRSVDPGRNSAIAV